MMSPRIDRARSLRKTMTDAERQLWHILRGRRFNGFKFRRQVPIGPFIADFLCFEARVIVEADGAQHAESTQDAKRDAWLASVGYRVMRFWNDEIFTARRMIEDTLYIALSTPHPAAIIRLLDRRPSDSLSPPPSPARGEGE